MTKSRGEKAGTAKFMDQAGQKIEELGKKAARAGRSTGDKVKEGYQERLQEKPLTLALAAFALGLVIGLAVPQSVRERSVLAEARDKAWASLKRIGEERLKRAGQFAIPT